MNRQTKMASLANFFVVYVSDCKSLHGVSQHNDFLKLSCLSFWLGFEKNDLKGKKLRR